MMGEGQVRLVIRAKMSSEAFSSDFCYAPCTPPCPASGYLPGHTGRGGSGRLHPRSAGPWVFGLQAWPGKQGCPHKWQEARPRPHEDDKLPVVPNGPKDLPGVGTGQLHWKDRCHLHRVTRSSETMTSLCTLPLRQLHVALSVHEYLAGSVCGWVDGQWDN